MHWTQVLVLRAYPIGQAVQVLVAEQVTSLLQLVPLSMYPPKQVRHPLLASQVAQGKGQAALHELPERV